jgi:hypothetical protein
MTRVTGVPDYTSVEFYFCQCLIDSGTRVVDDERKSPEGALRMFYLRLS